MENGREIFVNGYYVTEGLHTSQEIGRGAIRIGKLPQGCEFRAFEPHCVQCALLYVNRESRTEALKLHKAFGAGVAATSLGPKCPYPFSRREETVENTGPKCYYNPTADTFILNGVEEQGSSLRSLKDLALPGYPVVSVFREIESLIYINLILWDFTKSLRQFAQIGRHIAEDNILIIASIVSHPPWVWFRNLKSLVVKGRAGIRDQEQFATMGKDATTEITRALENKFKRLMDEDPSRSLPKITVQIEFMDRGLVTGLLHRRRGRLTTKSGGRLVDERVRTMAS